MGDGGKTTARPEQGQIDFKLDIAAAHMRYARRCLGRGYFDRFHGAIDMAIGHLIGAQKEAGRLEAQMEAENP